MSTPTLASLLQAMRTRITLRKFLNSMAGLAFSASCLAILPGCELTPEDRAAIDKVVEGDLRESPLDLPPPAVAGAQCFASRYTQPAAELTKNIDILFLTDTSGSLDQERTAIANGIDAFVAALPADANYRMGVMLGHGSKSPHTGKLYKKKSEPFVLGNFKDDGTPNMSLNTIRQHLANKLTGAAGDSQTDGGEAGLYAMAVALDHGMLTASRAHGFFRKDAALAIVFIADENDICATYPAGVTPVPDPDKLEIPAAKALCTRKAPAQFDGNGNQISPAVDEVISPALIVNKLKTVQGQRPLLVSGIIYNNLATVPAGGENEYGYGYAETIAMAKGISIDLAKGHFEQGLSDIGTLATYKLNLKSDFTLANTSVKAETIKVSVDGKDTPFQYVAATNTVHVSDPGTALSIVDITYCVKSDDGVGTPPDEEDPPSDGGGGGGIGDVGV